MIRITMEMGGRREACTNCVDVVGRQLREVCLANGAGLEIVGLNYGPRYDRNYYTLNEEGAGAIWDVENIQAAQLYTLLAPALEAVSLVRGCWLVQFKIEWWMN